MWVSQLWSHFLCLPNYKYRNIPRGFLFIILPRLVSNFCLSKSSCRVKPPRHVGRCVTQQEPRPRCWKLDPSNSEPNTQRGHYRIQAQAETPALGLDIWFVSPSEKLSPPVREEEKMKDLKNHLDMIIIMFCSNYWCFVSYNSFSLELDYNTHSILNIF